MDWLTQGRGELFKDEGQDAKRQFGEMEAWLSAQTDVKGRGDAAGVDALQQDLDLVVGQSQKWWLGSNQAQQRMQGETWGAAWDKDTEGRGDPRKYLFHVTDSVFLSSRLSPLHPSE